MKHHSISGYSSTSELVSLRQYVFEKFPVYVCSPRMGSGPKRESVSSPARAGAPPPLRTEGPMKPFF